MTNEGKSPSYSFDAVIFDLDGVITKTAVVHAAAWKAMFDEFLSLRAKETGEPFKEFTYEEDYLTYVDGKPRYKGVQSFLESRGIDLEYGDRSDSTDKETICSLGNRKNAKFVEVLKTEGAEVYQTTVDLIRDLISKGIRIGVASSSANCRYILQSTGLEDLFETRVDGVVSRELGLKGKPQGDIFVTAAKNVGATPDRAIVVEDAVSGVQAGVHGGFGLVIGVARENNQEDLKSNGADVVIDDFAGITTDTIEQWFIQKNNR
ncbi:MAG: beta-phosphoglucomutase family hydrolase [Candidatus Omnitrophica bacterium]|nr:beta-phosphoglucomutase family hydrolase [Candidatus Omnitrophota bacterium]